VSNGTVTFDAVAGPCSSQHKHHDATGHTITVSGGNLPVDPHR
jgi:hypothetical protein